MQKRHSVLALITFLTLILSAQSIAQTIVIPDTLNGWKKNWRVNLNGSQASYSNWSQGGVSSLSGTGATTFQTITRQKQGAYGFRIDLRYGQANIQNQGVRKTDDIISIRNRFTYDLQTGSTISFYSTARMETQFDKGFDYGKGPGGTDLLISDFFAPAFFYESAGLVFKPNEMLSFEAGLGLKQTFVRDSTFAPLYGVDAGKMLRGEGGFNIGINFQSKVMENVNYSSSLETFTNFLIPISETDVVWNNNFVGKINSSLNMTFQFELRYDNDFSSEIQLKQVLAAGLSYSIF